MLLSLFEIQYRFVFSLIRLQLSVVSFYVLLGRGGVWEECVITSPPHTQIIALSATLPNAQQLAEWIESVTNRPTKLIDAPGARPVPLKYLFATREGLFPLFRNPDAGPGAPLGLLGYRNDGIPSAGSSTGKKNKGFGNDDDDDNSNDEKIPKGLQVNPALSGIAQRRLQKVNRMLERQRERQRSPSYGEDDWDLYSGGRDRRIRNKNVQMSSREVRKERERILRREMRKAVPSLPILLARLKEKNLLPAIFFIFSRAGCDQAAETMCNSFKGPRDPNIDADIEFEDDFQDRDVKKTKKKDTRQRSPKRFRRTGDNSDVVEDEQGRSFRLSSNNVDEDVFNSVIGADRAAFEGNDITLSGSPLSSSNWKFFSSVGLLTYEEVREVAGRVAQFNEENPEIAFTDNVIEQLLCGVGRHHAGMLPAHKMVVETLFQKNIMKCVFSTETLAAGINMPARTTVVCALAKRGGGGAIELLETSNLLQMAGRAGRRGMDIAGTCVLVATPFEGEDVAAKILTNPIKPISSQFRPSYALAVNLIARGNGRLDVAKQLVSKSFANWGKQQLEDSIDSASRKDGVAEVLVNIAEEKFMSTLLDTLKQKIEQRSAQFDVSMLSRLVDILNDRDLLKKSSKSFEAATLAVELEDTTLKCLEVEMKDDSSNENEIDEILSALQKEDKNELAQQIQEQGDRLTAAEKQLKKHPFSSIAKITNELIDEGTPDGRELRDALQNISGMEGADAVDGDDISRFAKSMVILKKRLRKLARANPEVDPESLLRQTEEMAEVDDSSWEDMIAITKVLISYGCIVPTSGNVDFESNLEDETFDVTPAGSDVGMLNFENSLWAFVAMGGTWDVVGASSSFDEMNEAMKVFDDDDDDDEFDFFDDDKKKVPVEDTTGSSISKAQEEAEVLVSNLRKLSPSEMAGYVACLVTGDSGRSTVSAIDVFKRLDPHLQRSIQILLDGTERFMDVQRQFSVDERTCTCQFDLSHCEVIQAWTSGCTWQEALEISEAAPGDLTRIIGRVLDGLRQIGSLKYNPLRKKDLDGTSGSVVDPFSRGIHPEIRRLCREAAKEMNRYPVKDPLPFEVAEDEIVDEIEAEEDSDSPVDDDDHDEDGISLNSDKE